MYFLIEQGKSVQAFSAILTNKDVLADLEKYFIKNIFCFSRKLTCRFKCFLILSLNSEFIVKYSFGLEKHSLQKSCDILQWNFWVIDSSSNLIRNFCYFFFLFVYIDFQSQTSIGLFTTEVAINNM